MTTTKTRKCRELLSLSELLQDEKAMSHADAWFEAIEYGFDAVNEFTSETLHELGWTWEYADDDPDELGDIVNEGVLEEAEERLTLAWQIHQGSQLLGAVLGKLKVTDPAEAGRVWETLLETIAKSEKKAEKATRKSSGKGK